MSIYYKNLNTQCVSVYVRKNCNNNLPKNDPKITNILKTLDFENQQKNPLFLNLLDSLRRNNESDFSIITSLDIKNKPDLKKNDIIKELNINNRLVKITILSKYLSNIISIINKKKLLFYGMDLFIYLPTNDIRIVLNKKSLGDYFSITTNESNLLDFKKYATSSTSLSNSLSDIFRKLLNETNDLLYMRNLQNPMTVVPSGTTESLPTIDVNEIVNTVETELINNLNMIVYPTITSYLVVYNQSGTFYDVYSGYLLVKDKDSSEILFSISKEEIIFDNTNNNLEVLLNITDGIIDNEMNINQSSVVYSESNSQYTVNFSFKSFITIKNIQLNLYDENQPHPLQIIFNLNSLKISNTSIIYVTIDSSTNEVSDIYIDNVFIESLSEADVTNNIQFVSAIYNKISQSFSESQIEFIFKPTLLTNLINFTSELLVTNFEGNGNEFSIYFNCENIIQSVPEDFTNYMNNKILSSIIQQQIPIYISYNQRSSSNTVNDVSGGPTKTGKKEGGNEIKLSFSYNTFDYNANNGNYIYNISQFSEFSNTNLTVEQVVIYGLSIRYIYYSNLTTDNKVSFSNIESKMKFKATAGSSDKILYANYRYDINNVNITYIPSNQSATFYFKYQNNNISDTHELQLNPNKIINSDTIYDMVIVPNPNDEFNLTFNLGGNKKTINVNSVFTISELVPTDISCDTNVVYRILYFYDFAFST